MYSTIVATVLALSSVARALPEPAAPEYPEIIPGPGMPSLESLGLTSKDLYESNFLLEDRSADLVNYKATCFDKGQPGCTIADAQACVNYLKAKGNTACYVTSPNYFVMSTSGCYVHGRNIGKGKSTTSPCSQVGAGAQKIVDGCRNKRGRTEGTQVANGNPSLKITIVANPNNNV